MMLVKEEQPENAFPPMFVTVSGIVTEVKEEQSSNAFIPIISGLKESANIAEVRLVQPKNAIISITLTDSGTVTVVK